MYIPLVTYIFNDEYKIWKLDAQPFFGICRAGDVVDTDICTRQISSGLAHKTSLTRVQGIS